jgi:hypothetical protein
MARMQDENDSMRVDRTKARLSHGHDSGECFVDRPASECVAMVWELTQEVWSITDGKCAEQRLQRDVAVLKRQ